MLEVLARKLPLTGKSIPNKINRFFFKACHGLVMAALLGNKKNCSCILQKSQRDQRASAPQTLEAATN